jgi:hypothetical protein
VVTTRTNGLFQLNRAGNGGLVDLPPGFYPLAMHDWTIRWSVGRIGCLVDGGLLATATDHVPRRLMRLNPPIGPRLTPPLCSRSDAPNRIGPSSAGWAR